MPTEVLAAAAALTQAMEDNAAALDRVRKRLWWQRIALIALAVIVLAQALFFWQLRRVQIEACEANNEVRAGTQGTADYLEPILGDTPEGEGLIDQLRSGAFDPRDCS